MSATTHECTCPAKEGLPVKEYVRYKLGEFPFTTARKINHARCAWCSGIVGGDLNKELITDQCKNRLFIQEQDKMYSVNDNSPIIPIKGYKSLAMTPMLGYEQRSKQWHEGYIQYLRQVVTGDKVSIIPAMRRYEVYCNEEDKLSIAAKQFLKPDDYFKLTCIV